MTRFRIAAVAGVCVVAATLGACSSSNGSSGSTGGPTNTGGAPSGGGETTAGNTTSNFVNGATFTLAMSADPGNLDPQASAASNLYQFSYFAYDRLLNVSADGKIQSGLASSWQVNGTKTVLTMHKSITCADGTPFTAADAAANLNYVGDPKNKSAFLGVFLPAGATAKADESAGTVTVTSPQIAPFILDGLAGIPMVCSGGMKNRKMLATKTDGTGPYQLTETVANDHYTFTKRQGYSWGPDGATTAANGLPDKVIIKIIPNETTAANLLLSGGLNAATILGPDSQRLAAQNLYSVSVASVIGETWFNQNSGHLTADPKLRLALTQALDLAQLQKVITSGRGSAPTTFAAVPPVACPGNSVGPALPQHDLDKAKTLLDQDGWKVGSDGIRSKDGKQLTLTFVYNTTLGSPGAAAAELAGSQWKQLGAKVVMKAQDETQAVQTLFGTGDWDIVWEPVNVSTPDQLVAFLSGPTVPKGQNFSNIDNAAYTKAVAKASSIVGTKGCADWLAAEANLVKAADVVPFANQAQQLFGNGAQFAVSGELVPTSIRMTG
jgi:peptide/nickel transport system substrate-binding protein